MFLKWLIMRSWSLKSPCIEILQILVEIPLIKIHSSVVSVAPSFSVQAFRLEGMHTFLYRLNAVLSFALLALAAICIAASMTDMIHKSNPSVDIKVLKFDGLREIYGNDEARVALNISADLSSIFSWNTKQLFVFVAAEYTTPKNSWNQISLWDSIITAKEDAVFQALEYNKYAFIDQGKNFRGLSFNLTMYWHVMPKTTMMYIGSKSFTGFKFPDNYF
ncbi:hypothetical protein KP509_03G032100 [Ceratopteris richardii]|uniref:Signal peptidase complex subunit 3 n=1 Tax=Ceratopteris richardii TaxID=49495 RepID=A0A8T2UYF9_CERRI|nr:hypothetical protein KP509_03G032100 [Ceratopteris richardii]